MPERPQRLRKPTETFVAGPAIGRRPTPKQPEEDVNSEEENKDESSASDDQDKDDGDESSEETPESTDDDNVEESESDENGDDDGGSEGDSAHSLGESDGEGVYPEPVPLGEWKLHWNKDMGKCWAQDVHGDWYEARLVDVLKEGDPRSKWITDKHVLDKRGPKVKPNKLSEFEIFEGNWIRVHFQGWSASHDEWIQFVRDGYFCTMTTGMCWCRRHPKGVRLTVPGGSTVSAKMSSRKRSQSPNPRRRRKSDAESASTRSVTSKRLKSSKKNESSSTAEIQSPGANASGESLMAPQAVVVVASTSKHGTRSSQRIKSAIDGEQISPDIPASEPASPLTVKRASNRNVDKANGSPRVLEQTQSTVMKAADSLPSPSKKSSQANPNEEKDMASSKPVDQSDAGGDDGNGDESPSAATDSKETQSRMSGERIQISPDIVLELDEKGIPLRALPILQYMRDNNLSVERLLKMAEAGTYNTACRWWFKGEKLFRPAVMQGGATLIEWFESLTEKRPRRNVFIDVASALEYQEAMRRKKGVGTTQAADSNAKRKRAKPDGLLLDSGFSYVRRNATMLEDTRPFTAREAPSSGKWESLLSVLPGFVPLQSIGLFDSQEEALSVAEHAFAVIKPLTKRMRADTVTCERTEMCAKCGVSLKESSPECLMAEVGGEAGQLLSSSTCTFCPRKYHASCAQSCDDSIVVDLSASPRQDEWMCEQCELDLLATAVRVSGSGVVKEGANITPGLKTRRGRGRPNASKVEDELKYIPTRDGETEWLGVPYLTRPGRFAERRVFFSAFSRQDRPDIVFRVLDHVIIGRRGSPMADDAEEEQKNSPDFYIGQVEALWEDRETGDRFARIAWFFWPEETNPATETFKNVGEGWEVLTSSECDIEPITRVIAKTRVFPKTQFDAFNASASDENGSSSCVLDATTTTSVTESKVGALDSADQNAQTMRECPRCGMWGFRDATELGAHNMRFCGVDTPEALQQRRAEWGLPEGQGENVPRPATRQVELKPKEMVTNVLFPVASNKANQRQSADAPAQEDEVINPKVVARALARARQGPFFARAHYNQREGRVMSFADGSAETGENDLQNSVLLSTYDRPQTEFWASRAVVDSHLSCVEELGPVLDQVQRNVHDPCGFCGYRFDAIDHAFECVDCSGLPICLACVQKGRQGIPRLFDKEPGLRHALGHSYRIIGSRLDPANPVGAVEILAKVCQSRSLGEPHYELLEVSKSQCVPDSPKRPRFRYGVHVARLPAAICAEEFGFTIEQAKAQAALSALRTYFGSSHRLDLPLFENWTAWEAAKFIDGVKLHGLAWETVAPIVGTKDATHCRVFFSEFLVPSTTDDPSTKLSSSSSTTRVIVASGPDGLGVPDPKHKERLPDGLQVQVRDDARGWAERVRGWKRRREGGRAGTLFAAIEGSVLNLGVHPAVPGANQRTTCGRCNKPTTPADRVSCSACEDIYHANCATAIDSSASATSKDDWYCPVCAADEKFVYEWACWGYSGRMLCALADKVNSTTDAVKAWDYCNKILTEISRKGKEVWIAEQDELKKRGYVSGDKRREILDQKEPKSGKKRLHEGSDNGVPTTIGKKRTKKLADGPYSLTSPGSTVSDGSAMMLHNLQEENRALQAELEKVSVERNELRSVVARLTAELENLRGVGTTTTTAQPSDPLMQQ